MLPSQRYQQLQMQALCRADPLQQHAVLRLDALYERLLAPRRWYSRRVHIKGIYLWGSVGIGKSFLTDLFVDCLPPSISHTRQHYQHFMAGVHRELRGISGQANPLALIGKKLAGEFKAICIDELYITDLGDAMIVYNLFASLFNEGVALLITSNFAPAQLYKDELQPAIFQPAIRLIKAHTEELHLTSSEDYRRLQPDEHMTWFIAGEKDLGSLFDRINLQWRQGPGYSEAPLTIQQHVLQPVRHQRQLAWFTFAELCERPRSARDYLLLGERFKVMLVSGVPQFGGNELPPSPTAGTEDQVFSGQRKQYSSSENAQRRFISLVDECYDQGIKLYIEAAVPLRELYAGGKLAFEFQRTLSRLTEMQSALYRDRPLRSSASPL